MEVVHDVTQILQAHAGGNAAILNRLLPLLYDELHQIAHGRLQGERRDHTLNTTALVHEAYIKMSRLDRMTWQNRAHFLAMAALSMRNILVDYAAKRKTQKRGGDAHKVSIDDVDVMSDERVEEILALNQALERLECLDARQAKVVECRFFADMSIEETAHVLDVSPATVSRDWMMARAWLNRELA